MASIFALILGMTIVTFNSAIAQQVPDTEFTYEIANPAFAKESGPNVILEETRSRFLQRGLYDPLLKLLRADGYKTPEPIKSALSDIASFNGILIAANAFDRDRYRTQSVMDPPSAYSIEEVTAINNWVRDGGRLLLIADHAPFAGGMVQLAQSFGFTLINGIAVKKTELPRREGGLVFTADNGLNINHEMFSVADERKKLLSFMTFTGSAFIAPETATPLLRFPEGFVSLMINSNSPNDENTPTLDVSLLLQGATLKFGTGRIAVFGEAAAFSAQVLRGTTKHGMNNPDAKDNPAFIRAVMAWLSEGL